MGEWKPHKAPGPRVDGVYKANSQLEARPSDLICICKVACKWFKEISPSERQYL